MVLINYFAASVYAEEHNIFHSAHLVSQGEKRPQPNLTGGVIIFSLSTGHAEVKYWKARWRAAWWGGGVRNNTKKKPQQWVSFTCIVMIHDVAVGPRVLDNGTHNSEEAIFQHLCQYINTIVQSLSELYRGSESGKRFGCII